VVAETTLSGKYSVTNTRQVTNKQGERNKQMKKVGLLALAMVMALGALGVAYAVWAQPLFIDGTVNMGYIAAEFNSFEAPIDDYAVVTPAIGKSGAKINNSLYELADKLTINIEDAYPNYSGIVWFEIKNNGTVPFYLENLDSALDVTVRGPSPSVGNAIVTGIISITDSGLPAWSDQIVEPGATAWYKLQISVPGEDSDGPGGVWLDPVQNEDYTIEVDLVVTQST
jgi:hypothetical protein